MPDKVESGKRPMEEKEWAIILANKILDRHSADPDDDLAVLSRQLLRALEYGIVFQLVHEIAKEVGGAFAETHQLNTGLNIFRTRLRALVTTPSTFQEER